MKRMITWTVAAASAPVALAPLALALVAFALVAFTLVTSGCVAAPGAGPFADGKVMIEDILDPSEVTTLFIRCGTTGESAIISDSVEVKGFLDQLDPPTTFHYAQDQDQRAGYRYYVDLRLLGSDNDYLRVCPLDERQVSLTRYADGQVRWSAYYDTDRNLLTPVLELADRNGLVPGGD